MIKRLQHLITDRRYTRPYAKQLAIFLEWCIYFSDYLFIEKKHEHPLRFQEYFLDLIDNDVDQFSPLDFLKEIFRASFGPFAARELNKFCNKPSEEIEAEYFA